MGHRRCCCGSGEIVYPVLDDCTQCIAYTNVAVTGFGDWWDPNTPPAADCSCDTIWGNEPYVLVHHGGLPHDCCWDWVSAANICTFPRFGYQGMKLTVTINAIDPAKCDHLLEAKIINATPPADICTSSWSGTPATTWKWGGTFYPPTGPWVLPYIGKTVTSLQFCQEITTPGSLTLTPS